MSIRKYLFTLLLMLAPALAFGKIGWNDEAVKWHGFEEGVAIAKRDNKPVLLVVYADWCGVCKRYSVMFQDERIVKSAKRVVLIRLNQDTDQRYLKQFSLDGAYVPRTYILNKDLAIQPSPYKTKKYGFFLAPENTDLLVNILDTMQP